MKKMMLLSKAELKRVTGGLAAESEADRGCIIYTINGNTRTIVAYVNEGEGITASGQAGTYAANTGQRTGYDCPGDGFQHIYS